MALDRTVGALGVIAGAATTGSYIIPRGKDTANAAVSNTGTTHALTRYISGITLRETAGASAVVKVRDSFALPGPIASAADGAAGNCTDGLHMFVVTGVTKWGESTYGRNAGDRLEFTSAGTVIVNISGIPLFGAANPNGLHSTNVDAAEVVGRRIYATKKAAPTTGVTPTNAQWFLVVADVSTTIAAASNALTLPQATVNVASTTGMPNVAGSKMLVTTSDGFQVVTYTAVGSATTLTGCTGGSGTMVTGAAVTQPMIPNNTATTYALNVADGSFAATAPPIKDTAGRPVALFNLAANESVREIYGENVIGLGNDGGAAVEITSGAVDWLLRGV